MTEQNFKLGLDAFVTKVNAYSGRVTAEYRDISIPIIPVESGKVYQHIVTNHWHDLKVFSDTQLAGVTTKLLQIKNHQADVNDLVERLYQLKGGFKDYCPEPQTSNDWPSIKTAIENDLSTNNVPTATADDIVKRIGNTGGLNLYKYYLKQLEMIANTLNYAFERHLAIYMYYYNSSVYASYNKDASVNQNLSFNVSTRIRTLKYSLEGRLSTIYRNIKLGDVNDVTRFLNNLDQWIDTKLTQEVLPILIDTNQQWQNSTSSFYSTGKKAMKATDLSQKMIFYKASSQHLLWLNDWHHELKLFSDLYKQKNLLVDEKVVWSGSLTSIKDLINNPTSYDGRELIIRGKVKNLNVRHLSRNKVLSTADIEDANGRTMKVCLPYIKLDSGGIVEDSFVYIHGEFLKSNPEANGDKAVSIKRLNLGDLSQQNWEAWLRLELKKVYELVPHNLTAVYSGSSGNDGIINPVKYTITFDRPNLLKLKTTI
ncbi:MAG: hypothetical protein N4A35_00050 [Flavobacteriales bacterium]|jgi:hypothetical protein|nr:hypothetical protein [Flavobacteriales bacterium]